MSELLTYLNFLCVCLSSYIFIFSTDSFISKLNLFSVVINLLAIINAVKFNGTML